MKLTVLGSGAFDAGPERAASGFLLEAGNSFSIIDFGYGCLKNLQRTGTSFLEISRFFFTHLAHADHVSDLFGFLEIRDEMRPPKQLNLFGGPGFERFVSTMQELFPSFNGLPFKLNVQELEPYSKTKHAGLAFTAKPMKHVPSSLGYRFETGGKSIVFTGDTEKNENLVDLAKGSDLLVTECTYAGRKTGLHLNAEEVGEIASRANPKKVLLIHLSPGAEGAGLKALVGKNFKGEVLVASDLMQVTV